MSPPRELDRKPAGRPPARTRLAERKLAERRAARARIAHRLVHSPSAEMRSFDPMARGRLGLGAKLAIALAAVALSSGVHGGVYGVGAWFGSGMEQKKALGPVAIEVREREPEPEPEKPPPPPTVTEPERVVKRPERRKEEPPPVPPPPDPGKPPPRVVGLSLDSTAQGGSGPSFGVGNTREGQTDKRAADPKKVARVAPPPASPNQKASRIPTAGASYVLPKRKKPIEPPYPQELLTQGIEAAVTVLVSLDETGKVTSVKIIKGSGYPEFDESARKTALAESFSPATRNGTPIPYTLSYTYRFTIEDK
jgi:TonB family protein